MSKHALPDPQSSESAIVAVQPFHGALDVAHKRVDPCFMTGKGCVYTEVIDRELRDRKDLGSLLGFAVMPFRDNLGMFYKNCLSRYFTANFPGIARLQRADEVRRPGIVVCEGICKRIQESDFVTVDVSLPNANVFYELGLAYGIGHKLLVLHHDVADFGKQVTEQLKDIGCRPYVYHDLDPLRRDELDDAKYIWRDEHQDTLANNMSPSILFYEHSNAPEDVSRDDDIMLRFSTHVASAVGVAIQEICDKLKKPGNLHRIVEGYMNTIEGFNEIVPVKTDSSLKETQAQVDSAYCMIIRTGFRECHPLAYFWLGYGHARGKNVIPVTVIRERDDNIQDLAFDIRAQRHMIFIESGPDRFEAELTSSLEQMITADFAEWSRKRFWDRMLGKRGEVSIFTGALHNDNFGREMIGDWDLRAASELTSYFARQQYRAKIENPVYAPEYPGREATSSNVDYIRKLKDMMTDKNCILVASPDVNPLTEIVLGTIYKVPDEFLFSDARDIKQHPNAIVAKKQRVGSSPERSTQLARRFFYREEIIDANPTRRGFESAQFVNGSILTPFTSQVDKESQKFEVFGHLAIVPNPFTSGKDAHQHYIIVLNGVSGPATFALTHVITGGVTREFVSYEDAFSPERDSEEILSLILDNIPARPFDALDCIVKVKVGPSKDPDEPSARDTSDWRRILSWELDMSARQAPIKMHP
jgi:hypothetical protein